MSALSRTELFDRRSSHAKMFRLADGSTQVELSLKWPIHYLDAQGLWQDCDSTLRSDGRSPEYDLSCKKGWSSVTRLAKRSPQPVRIERGGCKLTLRAQGVANVTGTAKDNRLTFTDAWPDTDLTWYTVPEGLRKILTLKSAAAPSLFTFLAEADQLDLRTDADGVIRAWAGPFPAFELPAPWVHDANGVHGPATLTLRAEGGKQYLDLAIDPAWLADPARMFPLTLCPTVIQPDAAAGKDTYADENAPATNYGTADTLMVGKPAAAVRRRGFIEFALAAYAGHPCSAAPLEVYFYSEWDATDRTIGAHKITAAWDEATLTWNLQPAYDAGATATDVADTLATWLLFDILTLLNQWLAGTVTNYGVALVNASESTANSQKDFYSSDWGTPSQRPKLTLTFVPPTATPTSPTGTEGSPGTVTDDISPTLAWSVSGGTQANYWLQLFTGDGLTQVVDTGSVASGTSSYACAAGLLTYGTTYKWRVKVYDAVSGWSAYSAWNYFTPTLSAPVGLTATPHAAAAHTDLACTAHTGEAVSGYNWYRKLHAAADSTYIKLNLAIVTAAAYVDDTAQSGTAYAYSVTAVSSGGFESAKATHADGTVTYTGQWIGSAEVLLRTHPRFARPRRSSGGVTLAGTAVVTDQGDALRKVRLEPLYTSQAGYEAIFALFPAGVAVTYRDERGFVLRGKRVGDATDDPDQGPLSVVTGAVIVDLQEVSA